MASNGVQRRGIPNEILTEEDVGALLRACSHRSSTGIRNRALITVLYRGGLRLGEALALGARDVDPEAGTLRVASPHSGRVRVVQIDPLAFDVVARWLDRRRELGMNGRPPLFSTLSGEPLKQAYVRAMLPRLARRAGVTKRCHAHALRHTHAVELARREVPVEEIQQQLGHATRATTARYLATARLLERRRSAHA